MRKTERLIFGSVFTWHWYSPMSLSCKCLSMMVMMVVMMMMVMVMVMMMVMVMVEIEPHQLTPQQNSPEDSDDNEATTIERFLTRNKKQNSIYCICVYS